jgi:signal transduction histidine kinase
MSSEQNKPSSRTAILAQEYTTALASYLEGAGEVALRRAYEVGRCAVTEDGAFGLLNIAILHHDALEHSLPQSGRSATRRLKLKAAGEFLAESLSAYEMAHRSFREKNAALRHINEMLEQEARRIAHLLHDEAGQSLFAAQVSLAELAAKIDPPLTQGIHQVAEILNQVADQLRNLSHEVRPTILDDLGLGPALEFLAQGISKKSQMGVTVRSSIQERLPAPIEAALFRAIQEALTNVARHAHADHAEVRLEKKGQTLFCAVQDDGVGFNVSSGHGRAKGGLGLLGIRERLDSLGGTMEIRSQPGQGTQLLMTIPCEV